MNFWESFISKIIQGWAVTIEMLIITIPLGVLLAIGLAVACVYGNKPVSIIASGIVGTFRGFPLIVTIFIIFFALPKVGIYLSPFWSAVSGFILCTGAYQSKYIEGAIRSIDVGQSLAAQALGMSRLKEVIHIILPQAIRRALPGITNEIVYLILYSSLASFIGVEEIFSVARHYNSLNFRPIEIFLTAAMIYAFMATIADVSFKALERKLRIRGL
ncbi:MAG: amino acid ABC transporter permease [Candidatus Bathyarchaeia archaeon]